MESVLKSLLLTVVLARDVCHVEFLVVGLTVSLLLLQLGRLIVQRWISGLHKRSLAWARFFATCVVGILAFQVLARLAASTPIGSPIPTYVSGAFRSLGQTAASDTVQWLSLPWWPASRLIVAPSYDLESIVCLLTSLAAIPLAIVALIHVDAWVASNRLRRERTLLASGKIKRDSVNDKKVDIRFPGSTIAERLLPKAMGGVAVLLQRQVITASRYRSPVLFSFLVPTFLCLSPLLSDRIDQQWIFVVGGIALCTVLLAPPALQIDFRRDLRRMMLLRSLPVRPCTMVLGQIAIPVLVTLMFQWVTILIAASVSQPGCARFM